MPPSRTVEEHHDGHYYSGHGRGRQANPRGCRRRLGGGRCRGPDLAAAALPRRSASEQRHRYGGHAVSGAGGGRALEVSGKILGATPDIRGRLDPWVRSGGPGGGWRRDADRAFLLLHRAAGGGGVPAGWHPHRVARRPAGHEPVVAGGRSAGGRPRPGIRIGGTGRPKKR